MIPPGAYEDSWPERREHGPMPPPAVEVAGVDFEFPDDCLLDWGEVESRHWSRFDDLAVMEALLRHKQHRLREIRLGPKPPTVPRA